MVELEQYHIRIPKYLMDRIRSEVIERWGYDVKGGVGLIINETLEEKFRTEKVGTHTHTDTNKVEEIEKNGLARQRTNPEQSKIISLINMVLPDIYQFASKPREDNPISKIGVGHLEKIISQKFNVYDTRSIKRYIHILVANRILESPELNKFHKIVEYTLVNPRYEKEILNQ